MEQKMPGKRIQNYVIIVVCTVLLSIFFACLNGLMLDGILTYLLIDVFFLAVLLYMLENNRIHNAIGNSNSNQYTGIACCYGIVCLVIFASYFAPGFTYPAASLALFFTLLSNAEIAISCCSFLAIVLCVATGSTFHELAAYMLLILIGAQMAKTMRDKKYRLWGCMILMSVSLTIPMLFYYLAFSESRMILLLWNAGFCVIALGLYLLLADRLYAKTDYEENDSIEKLLREDYPLVMDIKNYSKAEYVHAMKVATIARKCAAEIGAVELLAAAAGFYYRLGILEGEPVIENGIRLAEENCFPEAIIKILSEYNGEQNLPSSKESAIVHMVDACVKKMELLSSQNLSSSWNQDMVIYQTLNEASATGIYDESGLSMNQFLKIRELLVREEIGYDNND